MANSYVTTPGDGTQTNFTVSVPYLDQSHIRVFVDSEEQYVDTDWAWLNSSTIQFDTAPAAGTIVSIQRWTSRDARLVDFQNGSLLDKNNLNKDSKQNFYIMQEVLDGIADPDEMYDYPARIAAAEATAESAEATAESAEATANSFEARVSTLESNSLDKTADAFGGFKNLVINGCFRIWQRATSQTADGYNSADRWRVDSNGSTHTFSQQAFTLGQTDVPGEPEYYARMVVSSAAGSANYSLFQQRVEGVRTLAGKTATLSFYAKADASRSIAVEAFQVFGTGGSPSADVTAISVSTVSLTTDWVKYSVTLTIPSISGQTLGSNGDDYLGINIWLDAGTDSDSRTNSLGQQSGTFEFAQVQLEEGAEATTFDQRPIGVELSLCHRYYWKEDINGSLPYLSGYGGANTIVTENVHFPTVMRSTPTVAHGGVWATSNCSSPGILAATPHGFTIYTMVTSAGDYSCYPDSANDALYAKAEL